MNGNLCRIWVGFRLGLGWVEFGVWLFIVLLIVGDRGAAIEQ